MEKEFSDEIMVAEKKVWRIQIEITNQLEKISWAESTVETSHIIKNLSEGLLAIRKIAETLNKNAFWFCVFALIAIMHSSKSVPPMSEHRRHISNRY